MQVAIALHSDTRPGQLDISFSELPIGICLVHWVILDQ